MTVNNLVLPVMKINIGKPKSKKISTESRTKVNKSALDEELIENYVNPMVKPII